MENMKVAYLRKFQFFLAIVFLCIPCLPTMAEESKPRDLLQQLTADLQNSPNDQTLREQIIKLALTLNPSPAIPQEVERFMARGQAAMEIAQEPGDFKDAAAEFEKAALAAPWLGNVYYNLGIVQDKAGDYPAAINNLKLYLLAAPDASDAKAVETLIYKIEFKQEKMAKESINETVKPREDDPDDWLKKLDGARYICVYSYPECTVVRTLDIRGDKVIPGAIVK